MDDRIESQRELNAAIRLILSEDGDLSEAGPHLMRAIQLWADNFEALQEAAHYFDPVAPDPARARRCAEQCRDRALRLAAEMDEIAKAPEIC